MRKKRVTYRPGKTAGAFGVIWGSIFILIGVFVVFVVIVVVVIRVGLGKFLYVIP